MPITERFRLSERARTSLAVAFGLAVFLAALVVLRVEVRSLSWPALVAAIAGVPRQRLLSAVGLTVLNYIALTGYDALAFSAIGHALSRRKIVVASFLAYAISNTVGFSVLSGATVRYRFYARWGVTTRDLSRVVVSYSITFWLGLFVLSGFSLLTSRFAEVVPIPSYPWRAAAGAALVIVPCVYLMLCAMRRSQRIGRFTIPLPSVPIAIGQLLLSSIDWALAGAVLYALLPAGAITFLAFLALFFIAILGGMISHVPGGVGVFEGLMVILLQPYLSSAEVLPALILFRVIYYLLPLCVAMIALVGDEAYLRRRHMRSVAEGATRLTSQVMPTLLSIVTFVAGLILLFSGATPAAPGRLEWIDALLPLSVIEASHFLASVIGAALLVLSQGLSRRLDAAYYLTAIAIIAGMAASLLKGFDYEEATLLLLVLIVLWSSRRAFDRRAAFFATRFAPSWMAAIAGALAASVWLGLFAFQHVGYSNELWWQFALRGEASRFLRGTVGAAVLLVVFALARLLRHAPHAAPAPTDRDLDDAGAIIARQQQTLPYLAFLRDKSLLFNQARTAFVMYAVQGRTWVALGDPVGADEECRSLVREFLEHCDEFGGRPVFYQIGKSKLHLYADFGLRFMKIGEEAAVDLTAFTLDGGRAARYRQAIRRTGKDELAFRVIEPGDVPAALPALRAISDNWLTTKAGGEKGFSVGFFDEQYLSRFPIALISRGDRVLAFANVWVGAGRNELSVDLMRYDRAAPPGIMETLFVHLLRWGHQHGYRRFVLGMAPLSGVDGSAIASFWNRFGAFLYDHGETVYHFQGLRAYKEKFNPQWEPRYLAYPDGLRLPRALADVSALIAGGYPRIFRK